MSTSLISLKNVCFSYSNETVLKNINLDIFARDFLGIIGPNGGGKTTLLKLILGILQPSSGFIESPHNIKKLRKLMGYVPQHTVFDGEYPFRVIDIIRTGMVTSASLTPFHPQSSKSIINDLLDFTGLATHAKKLFSELSGGQKQRCLIARALIHNPLILMLDEPTASIDEAGEKEIYSLLSSLKNTMTIIIVSHDIMMLTAHVSRLISVNKSVISDIIPSIKTGAIT